MGILHAKMQFGQFSIVMLLNLKKRWRMCNLGKLRCCVPYALQDRDLKHYVISQKDLDVWLFVNFDGRDFRIKKKTP
jgi:hypothetical protein